MFLGLAGEIETLTKTSTLIRSYLSVSIDRLFLYFTTIHRCINQS